VRANVTQQIGRSLKIAGTGGYVRMSAGLPPRGYLLYSSNLVVRGLFGSGVRDTLNGYVSPTLGSTSVRETARHWTGGVSGDWDAVSWLHVAGVYGADHVAERDHQFTDQPAFQQIHVAGFNHDLTTAAISARSAEWSFWRPSLRTKSIIGYSQLRSALSESDFAGIVASSPPIFSAASLLMKWRIAGSSLRQELAWNDQLRVGAGVRWERWSNYGARWPGHFFRSGDVSWLLGHALWVDSLRLRAAYGEAGNWSPGDPRRITLLSGGIGSVGADPTLFAPAERTKERELGADFAFTDRAAVSLTAYRADALDLYAFQLTQSPNVGALRNEGLELSSRISIIRATGFKWDATVRASALRDRTRAVGLFGDFLPGGGGLSQIGSRPFAYYTMPYTYADANHDGIIERSEVQVSNLTREVVGSSIPSREASLLSTWKLVRGLTLSGLLDYRGGQKLSNLNEAYRCIYFGNCRSVNDRTASLADQAQASVGFLSSLAYVENASFLKLREVSIRWAVPSRAASWAGGRAAITVAGRNLATWTHYRGLDPELNSQQLGLPRADLAETPIPHELLVRLDIGGGASR
jgi:hypothetical protein